METKAKQAATLGKSATYGKYSESKHGLCEWPIAGLKAGEFFRRVRGSCPNCNYSGKHPGTDDTCQVCNGTGHSYGEAVYVRGAYDAGSKRYGANHTNDMNREIFLKGSAFVLVGFSY